MRENRLRIPGILAGFILVVLLTGCGTSQSRVINRAISDAERKLGMSIGKKDYFPLYLEVADWLGTPYRYAGSTKRGTDCSGFTFAIVRDAYGKNIERSTRDQLKKSVSKVRKHSLREGDLVFFTSKGSKGGVAHVGIYLKERKFAHASSTKGVIVSSLDDAYWDSNWLCGGRIK